MRSSGSAAIASAVALIGSCVTQQQDEEVLSPSACAKRAVSLDREGGDQLAAAAWYSRAAAGLVEKSKSEAYPSDAKVKCLAKANEYDTRAQVLYAQPGNASADV